MDTAGARPWTKLLSLLRGSGARGEDPPPRGARLVCVGSGKGGTGKSVISTNLALHAAREGLRALLFDADLGLANAHLLLGLHPRWTLAHVVSGQRTLREVIVDGPAGLGIASGGPGLTDLAALDEFQLHLLASQIEALRRDHDLIVVDTAAGIAPQAMVFLAAAGEAILVTTRDLTAMTDAYAVFKGLIRRNPSQRVGLVANRVASRAEAVEIHRRVAGVAERFLGRAPAFLGWVPEDPLVGDSIARRLPLVASFPDAPAAGAIRALAQALLPVPAR